MISPPVIPAHQPAVPLVQPPFSALDRRPSHRAAWARGADPVGLRAASGNAHRRPAPVSDHLPLRRRLAAHQGHRPEGFRAAERRFASRADLVIASSPPLAARMRSFPTTCSRRLMWQTSTFATALEPGTIDPALTARLSARRLRRRNRLDQARPRLDRRDGTTATGLELRARGTGRRRRSEHRRRGAGGPAERARRGSAPPPPSRKCSPRADVGYIPYALNEAQGVFR